MNRFATKPVSHLFLDSDYQSREMPGVRLLEREYSDEGGVGSSQSRRKNLHRIDLNSLGFQIQAYAALDEDVVVLLQRLSNLLERTRPDSKSSTLSRRSDLLARTSPRHNQALTETMPWGQVDAEIQAALDGLWVEIASSTPGTLSRPGRTKSAMFPLFTYRIFYRGDLDEDDPVVAGIEIKDEGHSFRVSADIGSEESGKTLYSKAVSTFKNPDHLTEAVRRLLAALVEHRGCIEEAMKVKAE